MIIPILNQEEEEETPESKKLDYKKSRIRWKRKKGPKSKRQRKTRKNWNYSLG